MDKKIKSINNKEEINKNNEEEEINKRIEAPIYFNNIDMVELAKKKSKLTIKEFVKETKFEMEEIYIDKFWNSINNNDLILIDDQMVRWCGFSGKINKGRYNLRRILDKNNIKYEKKSYDEVSLGGTSTKAKRRE
jgi:ribosomal protein L24